MKFRLIAKTNTDPGHNFSIRRNYNFYSPVLFSRIPSLDQTRLYVYNYRSVSIKRATKNTIASRRLLIYTTKRLSVYLSFDLEESRRCCSHWEDRSLWKVYPVAEDIFCPFSSFSLLFCPWFLECIRERVEKLRQRISFRSSARRFLW